MLYMKNFLMSLFGYSYVLSGLCPCYNIHVRCFKLKESPNQLDYYVCILEAIIGQVNWIKKSFHLI